jgi:hypothetical protein
VPGVGEASFPHYLPSADPYSVRALTMVLRPTLNRERTRENRSFEAARGRPSSRKGGQQLDGRGETGLPGSKEKSQARRSFEKTSATPGADSPNIGSTLDASHPVIPAGPGNRRHIDGPYPDDT